MCVVSMIGDHYSDKWRPRFPQPNVYPTTPNIVIGVDRAEFEALRREVLEMKELLIKAKAYDEANGEPTCEIESKVALLRAVAEAVGVDLSDVLPARTEGDTR